MPSCQHERGPDQTHCGKCGDALPSDFASAPSAARRKPWQIEGEEMLPQAVLHAIDEQLMHFGEIPDRTSPDDFPEGYVLTRQEIVQGILNVLEAAVKAASSARSSGGVASDPGTVKILTALVGRAYKIFQMAGVLRAAEQDPDSNDPIVAWASDVRSILYRNQPAPDAVRDLQRIK